MGVLSKNAVAVLLSQYNHYCMVSGMEYISDAKSIMLIRKLKALRRIRVMQMLTECPQRFLLRMLILLRQLQVL